MFGCRAGHPTTGQPAAAKPGPVVLYPAPPAATRVIAMPALTGAGQPPTPPGKVVQAITGQGPEPVQNSQLIRPLSLAVRAGHLLVCDIARRGLIEVDPVANTSRMIQIQDAGPINPVAVAADKHGNAYIADAAGGRILQISPANALLKTCSTGEQSFVPIDLAVTADRLYAVDRASRQVVYFDLPNGKYAGPFPKETSEHGTFPVAVSLDPAGHIYIVDMVTSHVRVYDRAGTRIREFGRPGNRPGLLAQPRSVALGSDGTTYVTDIATQLVQMFNASGKPLMYFGGPDHSLGRMNMPAKIVTDRSLLSVFQPRMPRGFQPQYMIFVANQTGPGRIGVYAFGEMSAGETPAP